MLRLALPLILFTTLAGPLAAQEAATPGPVATLATALKLYDLAERSGDAVGMAVAVRLAGTIRQREAGEWPKESAEYAGPAIADGKGALQVTPDMLGSGAGWSGALLMAEEDEALSDLLYELAPPAIWGGVTGAKAELAPGREDRWTLIFAGQSPAEVAVFGMTSGDEREQPLLLWSVRDASDSITCPERPVGSDICSFTPGENGFYRIIIANPSNQDADYLLVSN